MIPKLKKNAYLVTTSIIFFLSVIFASATFIGLEVVGEINRTSVGFIYLGNKTESQYETQLNSEIRAWKSDAIYTVYFQEYTLEIDLDHFDFDSNRTLNLLRKNSNNRAYFLISENSKILLSTDFYNQFSDSIIEEFDLDEFIDDILGDLQLLYVKKDYQLEDYLSEGLYNHVIDTAILDEISPLDVNQILGVLTTISIPKSSRFSLLNALSQYQLNNTQLSIIASGLQGVLDLTPMSGFMYEQNRDLPIWADQGMNVRILQVNQYDFTFFNHLNYHLRLVIEQVSDTSLSFSLLGYPFVTSYESFFEQQVVIPYPTVIYSDESIVTHPDVVIIDTETETTYRLHVQEGVDGFVMFYYRRATLINQEPITYRIYDEQYIPKEEIIYEYIVYKEVI
jgi:hypothetical protein